MSRDDRLHLRLPPELKRAVQEYARRKNTNVTTLVTTFFTRLLEADAEKPRDDVEQV